jgi:predicted NUDIX family NTP pyrophosphohydrolase
MKLESFGTLLYRTNKNKLEVLLVHPSGDKNKTSAWSIPKGKKEKGETGLEAAVRETLEETGVKVDPNSLENFGFVIYKSKKTVHCYAGKADSSMKPQCASWEVDKAEFVEINKAKEVIHKQQIDFILRLESKLKNSVL